MGRDYPMGFQFFRERLKRVFLRNRGVTDLDQLGELHDRARFVIRELEAMYKLRKYRYLKRTYTDADTDPNSRDLMRALAAAVDGQAHQQPLSRSNLVHSAASSHTGSTGSSYSTAAAPAANANVLMMGAASGHTPFRGAIAAAANAPFSSGSAMRFHTFAFPASARRSL